MKDFFCVLSYAKTQKTSVILSMVCALLVAALFPLNIAAVLEVMKVLLEEECVHGQVYQEIIEDRTGLHLKLGLPDDAKTETHDALLCDGELYRRLYEMQFGSSGF